MPEEKRDRGHNVKTEETHFFSTLPLAPDALKIFQTWHEYLAHTKGFTENTLISYRTDMIDFLTFYSAHIGDEVSAKQLGKLHLSDLRGWIAGRHDENKALNSSHRAMSTLRNFYRYAAKHHNIESKAPFEFKLASIKQPLPKALNIEEVMRLIDAYDVGERESWVESRDKALLLLMYGSGLRISEALSVSVSEASAQGSFVRVVGKGNKTREVPILQRVRDALRELAATCPHIQHDESASTLFYGVRGKALQPAVFSKHLQALRQELGLPETTTAHAMRHSYATHLLTEGANLRDVQELLGHENLSTTQRYTKVDINHLMDSYSKAHPTSQEDA